MVSSWWNMGSVGAGEPSQEFALQTLWHMCVASNHRPRSCCA